MWTATGDCQMNISRRRGRCSAVRRTREAWDMWDVSLLTKGTGANENKAGQFNVNSDGTVTFSFPNGTVVAAS